MIPGVLILGLLLVASALKNTQHELATRLQVDLLGKQGFIAWGAAILAIGGLGYIPGLRTPSHYLLGLLAVVAVAVNHDLFANATLAIEGASALGPAPSVPDVKLSSSSSSSSSSGSGSGSTMQTAMQLAPLALALA